MTELLGPLIGAGASIFGSSQMSDAAQQAAQAQVQAAQMGIAEQQREFNYSKQLQQPFIQGGTQAYGNLLGQLPSLTADFHPEDLSKTPGYLWQLQQGTDAAQNSFAAMGLGKSGAALKGATNYAEGLAGTTYNQQFQNYLQQQMQHYNTLLGTAGVGANAAAGVGNQAMQTGQGIANSYTGMGSAQAAGLNTGGLASYLGANQVGSYLGSASQSGGGLSNLFSKAGSMFGGDGPAPSMTNNVSYWGG